MKKRPMYLLAGAVILLCGTPFLAIAQSITTGFATQPIFLSKDTPLAGQAILIYSSISNVSTSTFDGSVVFRDESVEIGRILISLSPGEARLISVSWRPTVGTHTVTATLTNSRGIAVAQQSADFTIASPDAAAASLALGNAAANVNSFFDASTTVQPATPIDQEISSFSPQIGAVIQPVLNGIDAGRTIAAHTLTGQITLAQSNVPANSLGTNPGAGLTSISQLNPQGIWNSVLHVLWSVYLYLLIFLRFIVIKFAIFYPLVVIILFWLLYRLYRRLTRPRWA